MIEDVIIPVIVIILTPILAVWLILSIASLF